ncbi:mannosyltransferase family protein [Patescibacteria group bacterium]
MTFTFIIAVITRIYLQILAGLGLKFISFKPSFPYWDAVLTKLGPKWLWLWGNFDGAHYIKLAQFGYKEAFTQAFFPIYPFLIKMVNSLTQNGLISGLFISHLSFIGFIYFFVKLGRLDYSKKTVQWASLLFLLFPTSFFLFSVYTESLFLFLSVLCFYLARQKKFLLASIIAGIASATRLVGIFLLLAILWEYYQTKKPKVSKAIGYSLLSVSGLLLYLNFLRARFGDILIFISSQPSFGAGRQVNKLVMIYQVIFRYIKMLLTVSPQNDIYLILIFELMISLIFLGLIIWALVKKLRPSYLLFLIPTYFLPTFTGTFLSMPRFLLTAFPLFYLLGNLKNTRLKAVIAFFSFLLLSWAFLRFSRGYWLA